jgi:flagella basal body P-ring formation protein FlgA
MDRKFQSLGTVLLCCIELLSVTGMAASNPTAATCASAQSAPTNSVQSSPLTTPSSVSHAKTIRRDPILRQRWITLEQCDHPERPAFARRGLDSILDTVSLPQTDQKESFRASLPIVRAGDIVRFWRHEDHLRIEVLAVSQESGGLGNSVHVRLMRAGTAEQPERQLSGVIRGPADVEMQ